MKTLRALAALSLGWLLGGTALAQTLPWELSEARGTPNYQSVRGVPISKVAGTPPGSDGRVPNSNESTGIYVAPTAGQYRTVSVLGGSSGLTQAGWSVLKNSAGLNAGTSALTGALAADMGLPVGKNSSGTVVAFLRRVQVGTPIFVRKSSLSFGSVIPVPVMAETGIKLPDGTADSYWIREPYTTNRHQGVGYYWSPHANESYAVQTGPIAVTWIKAQPYTLSTVPAYVNTAGTTSFMTNGANVFLLYTQRYVVSGAPVKQTRNMYWTQKAFQGTGKPILVPSGRVGAVNIVYNDAFPKTVLSEYKGIGTTSPTDGSTNAPLQELRTLWYEQQMGTLYAYNAEGRVFVELLGDPLGDGRYAPLGFEIVDVVQQPTPQDVKVELGERVIPPLGADPDSLAPEPLRQVVGDAYAYQYISASGKKISYYATRETRNLNDYLVHWMEEGVAGIRWPRYFGRYNLQWPTEVAKYSLYVRPEAATEAEAAATAVALEAQSSPSLEYQDPLDRPRAQLTSDFHFYSYLDASQPVHRSLLRYISGDQVGFERVFSWYVGNLRSTNYAGNPVVTNLTAWNGTTVVWPNPLQAPRVVRENVEVGRRIVAPAGEAGSVDGSSYVAGYIQQKEGTSFDVGAYLNPFQVGFNAAARGSIIPVNAIPGKNVLEVWWFRSSSERAGLNNGNTNLGFGSTLWPSAVGRYTISWPASTREIVFASKRGGFEATDAEAQGTIYYQNDPTKPGYNPNEEHALMSAGVPYATRDDLNIKTAGDNYSSEPYVLVSYRATDGRPSMGVFKVLREKPEAGWVFDYPVPAGQMMQPPPPLTFLEKPVVGNGDAAFSRNYEPTLSEQDLPGGWASADGNGIFGHYQKFTYKDRHQDLWVYRGPHAGLPTVKAGTYNASTGQIDPIGTVQVLSGVPFRVPVHASRQDEFMALNVESGPSWVATSGLGVGGTPPAATTGDFPVTYSVRDLYDQSSVTNQFTLHVVASGTPSVPASLAVISTNKYTGTVVTFTNRPPFLAQSPNGSNSFTMRYYYKTEASFAWPGIANPPAAGSIVPYLRPIDPVTKLAVGDPASENTPSLDIVYRPYWPERDPKDSSKPVAVLPFAATMSKPAFGLPGVRDFRTAHLLYQQSIASNLPVKVPSVVLHDPTRAKYSDIDSLAGVDSFGTATYAGQFPQEGLAPAGVNKSLYQGKYYFPNLPPHLATRVFLDPFRGKRGQLVLQGEFKNETLGESYLMLNVLRGSDLQAVIDLCPAADVKGRAAWEALVSRLSTDVETFVENPLVPGTYIPDTFQTQSVGVQDLAEIGNANIAVDSYAISATGPGSGYVTLLEASGTAVTKPGDPVAMHVFRVGGSLNTGEIKVQLSANPLSELVTFQFTGDMAGRYNEFEYQWKIAAPVDGLPPQVDASMTRYLALKPVGTNIPRVTIGGAGIQALGDNYVVMRYRPVSPNHPLYKQTPTDNDWSSWTQPALAEGWIKRVMAGINPFNQRVGDMFNNKVNTDVSLLTQAGKRWEGDVALNLDTINNYGLIEIYETVLRRGRALSIESGFNYGPANDALLLAAGYLSDLYMLIGNEAWADAANPTIGIGTADKNYGDVATSLFSFKGQVPTLLDEELGLLRGRDDFLLPGVEVSPVYNRMVWNYTRGIDSGEVIYALNYNIKEKADGNTDGVINAEDAAYMFPQGHGDAYGHYLTAIKGYYSLLLNANFDWVPRIESVNVLGKPVSVDYQDERKFATAAAALARSGRQVFDLTWRKDNQSVRTVGWEHLSPIRENTQRSFVDAATGATNHPVRVWGADHWASRVAQGTFLNWVVGNAILPAVDPNPTHEGIQKVDRTTVPELVELTTLAAGLNTALDNCEGGLSPLGISEGGLALDLNPNQVVGGQNGTHFEQIYQRAVQTLQNAVSAFDDAKDVTRLMRSEQDSLVALQDSIASQERAFNNSLIELYGTPYPDDIGPGKSYQQGYTGPDFLHYSYVEKTEFDFPELWNYSSGTSWDFLIRSVPASWASQTFETAVLPGVPVGADGSGVNELLYNGHPRDGIVVSNNVATGQAEFYFQFKLGSHGFMDKPRTWGTKRQSPGKIQSAISDQIDAHSRLAQELNSLNNDMGTLLKHQFLITESQKDTETKREIKERLLISEQIVAKAEFANDLYQSIQDSIKDDVKETADGVAEALPSSFIAGLAAGGDVTSAGRGALKAAGLIAKSIASKLSIVRDTLVKTLRLAQDTTSTFEQFYNVDLIDQHAAAREQVSAFVSELENQQLRYYAVNHLSQQFEDSQRKLRSLVAEGDRIQAERQSFRQHSASVVQGYRTRDAAFRVFRNEKLERYKTLLDLASRYALMAANAYDYETGLLGTSTGRNFVGRIVASRSLGVMKAGEPQFAGSNTGDPGLSSALAEMKADWDVLRGRLGFNNPDAYGTTVSLRTENFRILPGTDGDINWKDVLNKAYRPDLLADVDVKRHCMQIDNGSGLPVPGLVITFSTTIADGVNLFGRPLAAGDSKFSPTAFATKLHSLGVAFEGYRGMASPSANAGTVGASGGTSPTDPGSWFLDPLALTATPYVYLIPVGVDSMRSPPLGDQSAVRTWQVEDLAIPMPFNIGGSQFTTKQLYQSSDSLSEPLFEIRKHQAFRPVSTAEWFSPQIYTANGTLQRSQFTNSRLIGRSVWNSQWKLVIPGRELLANPQEGLDRFRQTVKDIKLHLVTYSYSGN